MTEHTRMFPSIPGAAEAIFPQSIVDDACALEAWTTVKTRDPIDVISGIAPVLDRRPIAAGLLPKGSFDVAWDLAH